MSDFRLKVFYSVAKHLSFTQASKELYISQPAITKHIRELESLYGVRLFDRLGNKISLTDAGKLMLEHCEQILAAYRRLEYDMNLLKNEWTAIYAWGPVLPFRSMCCLPYWHALPRSILK